MSKLRLCAVYSITIPVAQLVRLSESDGVGIKGRQYRSAAPAKFFSSGLKSEVNFRDLQKRSAIFAQIGPESNGIPVAQKTTVINLVNENAGISEDKEDKIGWAKDRLAPQAGQELDRLVETTLEAFKVLHSDVKGQNLERIKTFVETQYYQKYRPLFRSTLAQHVLDAGVLISHEFAKTKKITSLLEKQVFEDFIRKATSLVPQKFRNSVLGYLAPTQSGPADDEAAKLWSINAEVEKIVMILRNYKNITVLTNGAYNRTSNAQRKPLIVAAAAYRPPDTNLNMSVNFTGSVLHSNQLYGQISSVPDDKNHLLGQHGFTKGVGPANLGLTFSFTI